MRGRRRNGVLPPFVEPVTPDVTGFPKSVAQANHELVKGYKRIRNKF